MTLKQLLEHLNYLAEKKPEALEMNVKFVDEIDETSCNLTEIFIVSQMNHLTKKIEQFVEIAGNKYD